MQNYHRHTSFSNIMTTDSAMTNMDYVNRALELGHKVLSSVEHGWQGYYYEVYELAKKHGLKFIFGAEAYWVKDRFEKDKTNAHIILLARNENGRRAINRILSEANETGYYYKPRVDLELLLSLPPEDVFVTTACVGFWHYEDDIEEIILELYRHFGANFMLEIQNHNTEKQIAYNRIIHDLYKEYGIEMIVGLDSHYIYENQAEQRDDILAGRGLKYDDETGWYMDYPDDNEVRKRFKDQGVFSPEQVERAMANCDLLLEFEDIVLDDNIKLPTLYPDMTQEERNSLYSRLITQKFKEYMKDVPASEYERYYDGVKMEVDTYKKTGMVDYPLIDYEIVKRAIELGGIITDSGRGSGVGYFTNTLCGFSKVDRFKSPVKLYPERFISATRILETRSLPDLDLNTGNPEIFAQAQEEVMGKDHAYPMICFGTLKKKAAFKLYARAKNLDFPTANDISKQLEKYDDALRYADDDERDQLDINDFVKNEEHQALVEQSKPYWGIIADKKKAPCAYLLYQGSIREEIGLIKCKSDTSKSEYMTTVIDGAVAENYKFLKNDLLKVDVTLLIDEIFKRVGQPHLTVNELTELVRGNDRVWDIYANGWTVGVNQVEKDSTTRKVMKYKPRNISELSAFIAAIRPGFKSMYSKFESRKPFSYDIKAFDDLIQTPEFPQSFVLYQEQTMQVLNYAGFALDECYGILKSIAKKHPEKVRPLKARFIKGFKEKLMLDDAVSEAEAAKMSKKIWKIVDDSTGYSFNSAHAYCMALDSLYCAYLKAYYPHEFYEILLGVYSAKGKKDKVAILKQEMLKAFKIKEGAFELGADNRKFSADPDNNVIYPSLASIKSLTQRTAEALYVFGQKHGAEKDFFEMFKKLKKVKEVDSGQIDILVKLGFFHRYGKIKKILVFISCFDELYGRSQFSKNTVFPTNKDFPKCLIDYVMHHSDTETEKQYRDFNYEAALRAVWNDIPDEEHTDSQILRWEFEALGYVKSLNPNESPNCGLVLDVDRKYTHPKLTLCRLHNGEIEKIKVKINDFEKSQISSGDIIKLKDTSEEGRWSKDAEGKWIQSRTDKESILKTWDVISKKESEEIL